ncbi:WD40/YVTN/BNR-like repeat-containing protein [Natrononativus amylolyticus]|uniref:WD40/YVTN/BNR-like repeat-containing protein n=1 Tax=Natrononativus amylolyticus TaxID=2963434 RepID=UPI0020CD5AE5|nr:glycosyl hydrolase [Natrononativus amylolyticus]
MLLIGTTEGGFLTPEDGIEHADRTLESGRVNRVRAFGDVVFAATGSGLFRSEDGATTWRDLGVPRREVFGVLESPDGESLYAGTHPAHLFVSTDGGESWSERAGLREVPSYDTWRTPRHRDEGRIVSLGTHPDASDRLVAGVEVGGVLVSDDRGVTWSERVDGLEPDVHHVLVRGSEEYVVSTGDGLYRTRDAGRSWTRLDDDLDRSYFVGATVAGGRLYTAAATPPPAWDGELGPDAVLFESTDDGDTLEAVPSPVGPDAVVSAWAAAEGGEDVFAATYGGHVLRRRAGTWTSIGSLPAEIHSIEVV